MKVPGVLFGMLAGVTTLAAATYGRPELRIVYNASDSAPRGWYRVSHADHLRVGDYVVARLPEDVAAMANQRGYLPRSVPVLKRIAAINGQQVCVDDATVYIDGKSVARALKVDANLRALPVWRQCRALADGELFLLNSDSPASFDSRYFGPIDVSFVYGLAIPLALSR